ncbi:hypothetical protein CRENPOLYSF1_50001 [Crenothrix polyspora]|uniref:Uncharacterized protein n=1 Tax=Crenothrix polyspora TaxID=360316 RepID=A0A1R4HCC8_9GAMM|nr:hypothetical protein CRENPOLYSF1_50001 [Crenothrix polyspora]
MLKELGGWAADIEIVLKYAHLSSKNLVSHKYVTRAKKA